MLKQVNILIEPRENIYKELLFNSLVFGNKFLLVEREFEKSSIFESSLKKLNKFLLKKEKTKTWPGTILLDQSEYGLVNYYSLNEESINLLLNSSSGLYDWLYPDLPEDLILLRQDQSPWLISISHEKEAYFEMTEQELKILHDKIKGIDNIIDFNII